MEILNKIYTYIGAILAFLIFYRSIYLVIGFLCKAKKYPQTDIKKKYAIVIPARNEEKVLPKLIESIHKQTYDASLITIFVIADNCQDQTATLARSMGCVVYERNEPKKARKGYALNFLFEQIKKDYGINSFDGYMIFDADNLLKEDFIEQMNRAFVVNKNIVVGYRNTKNFETNIISSAYGIHFCNSSFSYHRPRGLLNLGTHIAGTGYCIGSHLLKDGWNCFLLTEDTELTIKLNDKNIKIGYCEEAIFYDEQPTKFRVAFRQRVRWTKGRLDCFIMGWRTLLSNFFRRKSFTSYDLFWYCFPYSFVSATISILYALIVLIGSIVMKNFDALAVLRAIVVYFGGQYISNLFIGALTIIREHKHIHCNFFKTILYLFTWPWFNMIGLVIVFVAVFKKEVLWTPILHQDNRTVEDIKKNSFISSKKE